MTTKLTTRQKMINMMYLVLTAMLALNVSSEILRAFFLIETSMAREGENTDRKIATQMQAFEASMRAFPAKTEAFYQKAVAARKELLALTSYIENLKKELENVAGGRKADGQLQEADNTDKPSYLLVTSGKGAELKTRIREFRSKLTALLDTNDRSAFKPAIQADDPSGSLQTWEAGMFDNTPAAASMVILEKLETDAKNTAEDVLNKLKAAITGHDVTVNNFRAGIIPSSRYIMLGERFDAEIFLAAWDSLSEIKVMVNNSEIPVQNGKAIYSISPNQEGEFRFKGVLESKKRDGEKMSLPFTESFFAFRPAATVAATNMNVLYIGVDNPISVSVPGMRPQDISVSATAGTITGSNGAYSIRVQPGQRETTINVSARTSSGVRQMGGVEFRVRALPKPKATLGILNSNPTVTTVQATNVIYASLGPDFPIQGLNYKVTEYTLMFKPQKGDAVVFSGVKGAFFTPEITKALKRLKPRDQIFIYDIKTMGPAGAGTIDEALIITPR